MDKLNYILMLECDNDICNIHDSVIIDLYMTESVGDFIKRCIDKIKSMFTKLKEFFKKIFGIKTKDKIDEIEDRINKNPQLKNETIEIKDINQVKTVSNKLKKQGKKVSAKDIIAGVSVTTVTIGGAIALFKKFNNNKKIEIEQEEKEAINNIEKEENNATNDSNKILLLTTNKEKDEIYEEIKSDQEKLNNVIDSQLRNALKTKIENNKQKIENIDNRAKANTDEKKREYNEKIQKQMEEIQLKIMQNEAEILIQEENIKTIRKEIDKSKSDIENEIKASGLSERIMTRPNPINPDRIIYDLKGDIYQKVSEETDMTPISLRDISIIIDNINTFEEYLKRDIDTRKIEIVINIANNKMDYIVKKLRDIAYEYDDEVDKMYKDIRKLAENEDNQDYNNLISTYKNMISKIKSTYLKEFIVIPDYKNGIDRNDKNDLKLVEKFNIKILDETTYKKYIKEDEKVYNLIDKIDDVNKSNNTKNKINEYHKNRILELEIDNDLKSNQYEELKKSLKEI